jgi:hypothetical protein
VPYPVKLSFAEVFAVEVLTCEIKSGFKIFLNYGMAPAVNV